MAIKASTAVKRLSKEILQLEREKQTEADAFRDYTARPLEDNLFEWHFTIRGPRGTEFEGGKYHGKIILPQEYPFKPPSIILLTPNGRFALNKKICLSITGFHPEYWQPAWDIRSVLLAIISMFPTQGDGAVGALYHSESHRRALAKQSGAWVCPVCGSKNSEALPDPKEGEIRPSRVAGAEEEALAPVQIPGISFAYEGDKPALQSSPEGAEDKSGKKGSVSIADSEPAPDGGEGDLRQATTVGVASHPCREEPIRLMPAAATETDHPDIGMGSSASTMLQTDEVCPGAKADRLFAPAERPSATETPGRPEVFEQQDLRERWKIRALDLVITVLVCIIADRLAKKYFLI